VRSLLITSAVDGEGKSYVAMALARCLGDAGSRVLLVDAQGLAALRAPLPQAEPHATSRLAEVSNEPQQTDHAAVYRLTDGGRPEAGPFQPRKLSGLMNSPTGEAFDLLVIDGPAIGTHPEWLSSAAIVDRVLVVIEAERTAGWDVVRTVNTVEQAGGRVLGAVLNKRRFVIPAWINDRVPHQGRREHMS